MPVATPKKALRRPSPDDSYLKLVIAHPLVSIRAEAQLDAAQAVIDRLMRQGALNAGEEMYLDALSDLVAAYEDVHHPIEPASDADMLQHLLEARNITQAELSRRTGIPKSTISEVLAGKKPFSKSMIRVLAEFFHVDKSLLMSNL